MALASEVLSGVVRRGRKVGIPPTQRVIHPSTIEIWVDTSHVGFITQLNEAHSRPVRRLFHIEYEDPGRTVDFIPGPEITQLQVTGFGMYNLGVIGRRSLLNRMVGLRGLSIATLHEQQIPFTIIKYAKHPMPSIAGQTLGEIPGVASADRAAIEASRRVGRGLSDQRTLFYDCMITNYTSPVNIANASIAETVTIEVGSAEAVEFMVSDLSTTTTQIPPVT